MSAYSIAAIWSTTSHIGVMTSMLLRNIIFARFLSPTDFATALTFGVVLSLFEYISNFGHENLMQRSKEGNKASFQATMQTMMIARGLIVAILITLIAPFVPKLLNLETISFNYALLAVVPFINGFAHLDHQRLHRRQIYSVSAKISLTADISSILIALMCVSIWDSYWAFYISFVFRHSANTFLSHLWARRNYVLALESKYVVLLLKFGAPLLAVGVLKYIGTEVDKAIVAHVAGLETFAVYILTLMLVVNGTNIVNVALSKIFIRRLSVAGNSISTAVRTNGLIYCYLLLPLVFILCVFGEDLIELIFGRQYSGIPFLILAVCAVVGLRSLNHWLNQTVIACAPTSLMLAADITRVVIALIGVSLVYSDDSVIRIAIAFWFAELAYFVCLTSLLQKRFPILATSVFILAIYSICIAALIVIYNLSHEGSISLKIQLTLPVLLIFYGTFLVFSTTCRRQTIALRNSFAKSIGIHY